MNVKLVDANNVLLLRLSDGFDVRDVEVDAETFEKLHDALADLRYTSENFEACALVAHRTAEHYRQSAYNQSSDSLNKKELLDYAKKWDEVAAQFLNSVFIRPLVKGTKVIAYKIKGSTGNVYNVGPTGDTCTCDAASKKNQDCWHMRAVKVINAVNNQQEEVTL